jgi:hypothetical protein
MVPTLDPQQLDHLDSDINGRPQKTAEQTKRKHPKRSIFLGGDIFKACVHVGGVRSPLRLSVRPRHIFLPAAAAAALALTGSTTGGIAS